MGRVKNPKILNITRLKLFFDEFSKKAWEKWKWSKMSDQAGVHRSAESSEAFIPSESNGEATNANSRRKGLNLKPCPLRNERTINLQEIEFPSSLP